MAASLFAAIAMYFDPRKAKQLQPGEHMVIDGCQGLRLEARPSCKTWIYRYKLGSKMKQAAIGKWPAMSATDAAIEWAALRDKKASGVDPRAAKKAQPVESGYSVKTLIKDYIDGHIKANRKAEGALAAESALNRLLDDDKAFATSQAAELTRGVAFGILEARKATPTAAAKLRSMLGGAWEFALDSGKLQEAPNWWREVKRGKLKSKGKVIGGKHVGQQRRVLRESELTTLMNWLQNMHPHGRDITRLYLWTCTRGSEILSMKVEHMAQEDDGWWWTIPKALTKNCNKEFATDHRVPLVGRALEIVLRRMEAAGKDGVLFKSLRGKAYTQRDFSTYIYNMQPYSPRVKHRESEGLVLPVSGWSAHDLRRTSRTLLGAMLCPTEVAEAIMGHLPTVIEATYNLHSYDAERREWLTKLDARLEGLIQAGLPVLPNPALAGGSILEGLSDLA